MGIRGVSYAGAVVALVLVPAAQAGRTITVGYRTPVALRGLHVLRTVPQLRIATVAAGGVRALRARPGVPLLGRSVSRTPPPEPAPLPRAGAAGAAAGAVSPPRSRPLAAGVVR